MENNHLEATELLLSLGADITKAAVNGWAPIHIAVYENLIPMLKFILKPEFKINLDQTRNDGITALHIAVINRNIEIVRILQESQCNVLIEDSRNFTPFYYAMFNCEFELANLLLKEIDLRRLNQRDNALLDKHINYFAKSRADVFKLIAKRYGLGYVEINKKQIALTAPYLFDIESKEKNFKIKSQAMVEFYEDNRLICRLLGIDHCINFFDDKPLHLYCSSPEKMILNIEIEEVLKAFDKKFHSMSPTQIPLSENNLTLPFFNHCYVGIKYPIFFNKILYDQAGFSIFSNQYSLIFNFESSESLKLFLESIPLDARNSAAPGTYATYECNNEKGSYQILIPKGREYEALELFLGQNYYLSDLPIVRYLVNSLKPKLFLKYLFEKSITNQQFIAVITVIQKLFEKQLTIS